jgi:hypothetical protein
MSLLSRTRLSAWWIGFNPVLTEGGFLLVSLPMACFGVACSRCRLFPPDDHLVPLGRIFADLPYVKTDVWYDLLPSNDRSCIGLRQWHSSI